MKSHTEIYMKAYGYDKGDFISCEITGQKAVDICHIDCRGMGGNPKGDKNRIENLMANSREAHNKYGDKKQHMKMQYIKHRENMDAYGVKYDKKFMESLINKF